MVKKIENKVVIKKDITKSITDFLNVEYLNYASNIVSDRAIPSICDGFKPGARKIVHAMFEGSLKNGATTKLLAPNISSQRILKFEISISLIEIKMSPDSFNKSLAICKRGYIIFIQFA